MSYANFKNLRTIMDEEAYAEAYADFIESKANESSELLDLCTEAMSIDYDEDPDIEQILESALASAKNIRDSITNWCENNGYDLSSLDCGAPEYKAAIDAYANAEDSPLHGLLDGHYSSESLITENLPYFFGYTGDIPIGGDSASDLVPTADFPSLLAYNLDIEEIAEEAASDLITAKGISADAQLNLGCGFANIIDVIKAIIEDSLTSNTANSGLKIAMTTSAGTAVAYGVNRLFSFTSLCDMFKSNLASSFASAAFYRTSTLRNVSDRLLVFENLVTEKFSNLKQFGAEFINSCRRKLSDAKASVSDLSDWFESFCGVSSRAQLTTSDEYVSNSDLVSQYTGCSPMFAVDWSFAKAATGVAAVACKAGALMLQGLRTAVKNVFSKAKDFIVEHFINANDVGVYSDTDSSGLINGFAWQGSYSASNLGGASEWLLDSVIPYFQQHKDEWMKLKTKFAEVLIRFDSITYDTSTLYYIVEYTMQMKPVVSRWNPDELTGFFNSTEGLRYCHEEVTGTVLHSDGIFDQFWHSGNLYNREVYNISWVTPPYGWNDIPGWYAKTNAFFIDFMNYATNSCSDIDPSNVKDYDIAESIALSTFIFCFAILSDVIGGLWLDQTSYNLFILQVWMNQIRDLTQILGMQIALGGQVPGATHLTDKSVTNKTLVTEVAGCISSGGSVQERADWMPKQFTYNDQNAVMITVSKDLTSEVILCLNIMINLMLWNRSKDSADYTFVPFNMGTTGFSKPQYYIKTDTENQQAATTAATVIVGVVIVAVTAATIAILAKKIKLKRMARMTAKNGMLDSKMWNNYVPTAREMRRYNKRKTKLSKLESASSGLVSNLGAGAFNADLASSGIVQTLSKLFGGYEPEYGSPTASQGYELPSLADSQSKIKDNLPDFIEKQSHDSMSTILDSTDSNFDAITKLIK